MKEMSSKQRLLTAIQKGRPDRLPAATHHLMPYFLNKYMNDISNDEFFEYFGLDQIVWTVPHKPDETNKEYYDPNQLEIGFLESHRISTDEWRVEQEEISDPLYKTIRYSFITPSGTLSMVLQANAYTSWVIEHLIKNKNDIEIIGKYATHPKCDIDAVNRTAGEYGNRALIRGHVCCFDIFGQPGCWQDAACLVGVEKLIMETYDDPQWVHELLRILQRRKKTYVRSLEGARYDVLELGGGDASSTVISPGIFDEFVAPYDSELIAIAHKAGQRISYHTCGGMMAFLEKIATMEPDAMETFTPEGMGGDTRLAEAKARIGSKVCMIGGFDQFHYLKDCSPEVTRAEVRRCFKEAGKNGGYILSPSDHFFDADIELIRAFADEARKCIYD
jgi:uroporphyrinogen decarboxylase